MASCLEFWPSRRRSGPDKHRVTRLELDLPTKSQRNQHPTFFTPPHQDNKYVNSNKLRFNFKTAHAEFHVSFEPAHKLDFTFTFEDGCYTTNVTNGRPHPLIPIPFKYNDRKRSSPHHLYHHRKHTAVKPQPSNNHNLRNQVQQTPLVQTPRLYLRPAQLS
jgi:hypothetical protein